ncbi:hypothetical protein D3C76_1174530 [compost metagenome]
MNPGRNAQGGTVDAAPLVEQLLRAEQPALRQFLRAVHGDLAQAMLQAVVGKARPQVVGIHRKIDAGRHVQSGCGLLDHVAFDEARQLHVADGFEDRLMAGQQPHVGQQ